MAFLQDSRPPREPFLVAPASVLWLIAAILGAHVLRGMLPEGVSDQILNEYAFLPVRYSGSPDFAGDTLLGKAIPFVSHIFLHANLAHVGLNCVWLLAFGPVVARRLGALKFLLFFLVCGIAGVTTQLIVYWGSDAAVIGASGAIAGLMGAAMRIVYGGLHRLPLAPLFSRQIVTFTLIWTIVNVVSGVFGLGLSDEFVLVAWVVHLGGYFAGLLAIGMFDRLSLGRKGLPRA
jgi:membrane associated rhomboid family serine protease